MRIPGRDISWKDFFTAIEREWEEDKLTDVAGSLTFSGILALFPFLLFVVSLASIIIDPSMATYLVRQLYRVAPDAVAQIVGQRIHALATGDNPALLTFSGIGSIWVASGGVAGLTSALNAAYDVEESRPYWKVRGLSVLITLASAVLVILASAIAVVTPSLAKMIGGPVEILIRWIRIPIAALLMMLVFSALYYVLPNTKQPFRFLTPGAVVAVLIWLAASLGFSYYVNNFGRYDLNYGALGGVIVLLLWMWISSLAVLIGAEINTILERHAPEVTRGVATRGEPISHPARIEEPAERPAVIELEKKRETSSDTLPRKTPSRLWDTLLGVFALVAGYFVGKRLRK